MPRPRTPDHERAHPRSSKRTIKQLLADIEQNKRFAKELNKATLRLEKQRAAIIQARKRGKPVIIPRTSMLSDGLPGAPIGLASTRREDRDLDVLPRDFPQLLRNINRLLEVQEYRRKDSRKRLFGMLYEYRERMPVHHAALRTVKKKIRSTIRRRVLRK